MPKANQIADLTGIAGATLVTVIVELNTFQLCAQGADKLQLARQSPL